MRCAAASVCLASQFKHAITHVILTLALGFLQAAIQEIQYLQESGAFRFRVPAPWNPNVVSCLYNLETSQCLSHYLLRDACWTVLFRHGSNRICHIVNVPSVCPSTFLGFFICLFLSPPAWNVMKLFYVGRDHHSGVYVQAARFRKKPTSHVRG